MIDKVPIKVWMDREGRLALIRSGTYAGFNIPLWKLEATWHQVMDVVKGRLRAAGCGTVTDYSNWPAFEVKAKELGIAVEYVVSMYEKGLRDREAGLPCRSANGAYLDGWYSQEGRER